MLPQVTLQIVQILVVFLSTQLSISFGYTIDTLYCARLVELFYTRLVTSLGPKWHHLLYLLGGRINATFSFENLYFWMTEEEIVFVCWMCCLLYTIPISLLKNLVRKVYFVNTVYEHMNITSPACKIISRIHWSMCF